MFFDRLKKELINKTVDVETSDGMGGNITIYKDNAFIGFISTYQSSQIEEAERNMPNNVATLFYKKASPEIKLGSIIVDNGKTYKVIGQPLKSSQGALKELYQAPLEEWRQS